jgi:hypothetical protein
MGSIPASFDTMEPEWNLRGRQMKECWIKYIQNHPLLFVVVFKAFPLGEITNMLSVWSDIIFFFCRGLDFPSVDWVVQLDCPEVGLPTKIIFARFFFYRKYIYFKTEKKISSVILISKKYWKSHIFRHKVCDFVKKLNRFLRKYRILFCLPLFFTFFKSVLNMETLFLGRRDLRAPGRAHSAIQHGGGEPARPPAPGGGRHAQAAPRTQGPHHKDWGE